MPAKPAKRKRLQKASKMVIIAKILALCAAGTFFVVFLFAAAIIIRRGGFFNPPQVPPQARRSVPNNGTIEQSNNRYLVSSVYDGDTLYLKNMPKSVRLIGIDAPEMYNKYTKTAAECGGIEAKEKLKDMVFKKQVFLELPDKHEDEDKYHRLLRYVLICSTTYSSTDCTDAGLALVRQGWAQAYNFGESHPKDKIYREAQNEAKEEERGIWGLCR